MSQAIHNADHVAQFFDEAAEIVGIANLSRDASSGALENPYRETTYGDAYPLDESDARKPLGAVRPTTVEDLQALLKLADKLHVPLWVVSRGKNLGYGGTAAVVPASVVLDLHKMNKIIEIDETYAYAIVEPGVSFFDLFEEVERRGLDLWPSCPAIGWGSIIGNTLDRGIGYTSMGEHWRAQCGMEVVLPSGELLRTGMGAMEDSKLWPLYQPGYGPSIDGLFFQSNLGVVTKMGIQMTPAPETMMSVVVSVPNEEDLVTLISCLSDLRRRGVIGNDPTISNLFRQAVLASAYDPNVRAKLGPHMGPRKCIPETVLNELKTQHRWGFWKAEFALYGTAEVVPAQYKSLQRALSSIDGVEIQCKTFGGSPSKLLKATDFKASEAEDGIPFSGVPTLEPLTLMDYRMRERSGHVCFSPLIPPSDKGLYSWYLAAKKLTAEAGFDFFADFHLHARHLIAIDLVVFAPEEQEEINKLYGDLLEDGLKRGYSEYRTHILYMDKVKSHFSYNNNALGKFTNMIKDHVDPNGILSPGKSGIWGNKRL